jgi:GT2 family glycosyltransferase
MISVIIVSYNNPDLLKQTLLSLKTHHKNFETIIVDNSDRNDVEKMISKEFPDAIFKRMESNVGFGKANNIGIQQSNGEIIVFLNSDVVFEGEVISQLVRELEKENSIGIIGPKLLNADKSLQYSCCNFPSATDIIKAEIWGDYSVKSWYLTDWDHRQRRNVDYISGALMIMRKEIFESFGGFDDRFFMYSEEVDLCYRLKKTGYHIAYFPDVQAIHIGGASTSNNDREINVNLYLSRLKFRLKHYGFFQTLYQISGIIIVSMLRCFSIPLKIFMIEKKRDLRINQWIRNCKKLKFMLYYLLVLISRTKNSFLNYQKQPF